MTSTSPLSGYVVVELGHNVAGPVGGQILAELGAKVVKVEDPGTGDAARHWPPVIDGISTVYRALNRSKAGVTVDFNDASQLADLKSLILNEADVVRQKLRPGVVEKYGLDAETLRSEKLDRKTIFVFLSDNGPEPGQKKWASAEPFRGLKWSSLEGGTRVPCIIRWPGVIPAGRESDQLTAAIDLLPTLAGACGIDLEKVSKASPKIDGVNVWDTLLGKEGAPHARTNLLYWNGWAKLEAIRDGDWKLFLGEVKEVPGSARAPVLIHLKDDPAEQTDLAGEHSDRVKAMQALAAKLVAEIEANSIPLGGE